MKDYGTKAFDMYSSFDVTSVQHSFIDKDSMIKKRQTINGTLWVDFDSYESGCVCKQNYTSDHCRQISIFNEKVCKKIPSLRKLLRAEF